MVSHAAVETKRAKQAAALARGTHGYVPTPGAVAEELCAWPYQCIGSLVTGARVLEPSAGTGAVVAAILEYNHDVYVTAVDVDAGRLAQVPPNHLAADPDADPVQVFDPRNRRVTTIAGAFEEFAATNPAPFEAVIMNPPFSTPGRPRLWVEHILLAWELLAPGGRLVSIVPGNRLQAHSTPPAGKQGRELYALVQAHGGCEPVEVDRDAERAGFPRGLDAVWLVKPLPERADGTPTWMLQPAAGDPVDVPEFNPGPSGLATPVQRFNDPFNGYRLAVLRFAGTCHGCTRLLWARDGTGQDSALWSTGCSFDPAEFGKVGPVIGLCLECASRSELHTAAKQLAAQYWTDPVEQNDTPEPELAPGEVAQPALFPDVWGPALAKLGS